MKLISPIFVDNTSGAVINLPDYNFTRTNIWPTLAYSGVKFGSDGDLYARRYDGDWSRFGTWLVSGTASNYYLSRVVSSGTLTTDAGGTPASPLQLNSDRIYDVQDQGKFGGKVCSVIFSVWSDTPGTVLMDSNGWTFDADSEFEG